MSDSQAIRPPGSPHKLVRFKSRYVAEIQSIMYTSGDVKQPEAEAALCIEELVHDTLIRLLRTMALSAVRRGARTLSPEDLLFVLRHNSYALAKLREYLEWREIRKISQSSKEEELEEVDQPSVIRKRMSSRIPWCLSSLIDQELLNSAFADTDEKILDAIDDVYPDNTRSKHIDSLTKAMSPGEYMEYSESRQSSSFTYKKSKKFREWLAPAASTDYRVSDEVLEMFGLVGFIIVESIVQCALMIKDREGPSDEAALSPYSIALFTKPSAKTAIKVNHVRTAYLDLVRTDPLFQYSN